MVEIIRVTRLTDRQVLKLIDALIDKLDAKVSSLSLSGVSVQRDDEQLEKISRGKDLSALAAFDVNVGSTSLIVQFRRGIGGTNKTIDSPDRTPSPYYDEIGFSGTVDYNGHAPSAETVINARRLIIDHTAQPTDGEAAGHAREAVDLLKLQFAQLNEQLLEVNTASLKRREDLEDEFSGRRQELDDELVRQKALYRDESERLAAEHGSRLQALEQREKQLDDRDHIHARRELRTHMTEAIAQQVQGALVPRNASRMRWAVFSLMLAGAFGLAGLAAWSLIEFGRLTYLASLQSTTSELTTERAFAVSQIAAGFHWLVLARGFVAGVAAIGFLLYAINWLKGIYHDEVRTRRELQRYATDLNRASWAIETIMEARSSGDAAIPDAVIAGVTRNLFEATGGKKANAEASANALAELLRTSGKARFGPNGAEFELTSRGANRLAERLDE